MRCDHCGFDQEYALRTRSLRCAPPFKVQAHSFTGKHPADQLEPPVQGRIVDLAEASFNAGWDAAIQACIAEGFYYHPMPGDRLAVANLEAWKEFRDK